MGPSAGKQLESDVTHQWASPHVRKNQLIFWTYDARRTDGGRGDLSARGIGRPTPSEPLHILARFAVLTRIVGSGLVARLDWTH